MHIYSLIFVFLVSFIVLMIFFFIGKSNKWEKFSFSSFECGFSSYFFSRFSFSIHYFLVSLIFLFLDLELCLIMPMMLECVESKILSFYLIFFVVLLLIGLLMEWKEGKLEWIN